MEAIVLMAVILVGGKVSYRIEKRQFCSFFLRLVSTFEAFSCPRTNVTRFDCVGLLNKKKKKPLRGLLSRFRLRSTFVLLKSVNAGIFAAPWIETVTCVET